MTIQHTVKHGDMTEEEIQQAAKEYSNGANSHEDYIGYTGFEAGAKWMWEQLKEEIAEANRNKDMCWMAYKMVKDELNEINKK